MAADVSEVDLAYAAGIIDGEGSICISSYRAAREHSPSFILTVTVIMTDPRIPEWLAETFGGSTRTRPPRKGGRKPTTTWRLTSARAERFCSVILPYMRLKHRQAELVCGVFADSRILFKQRHRIPDDEATARSEYVERMRTLNREGRGR